MNARLAVCREEDGYTMQLRQIRSDLYMQLIAALHAAKRYQVQGGTCMTIQQHPSPNYGSRYGWKPDRIVNHITAGSTAAGALATLCDPKREASAHFVIDKDGAIYQLVALDRAAWANGTSISPSDSRYYGHSTLAVVRNRCTNANYYTISIEHVCVSGGALTPEQLTASIELHRYIITEVKRLYGVTIPATREYIVGHSEINPKTKPDCPGERFPFDAILEGLQQKEVQSDTSGTIQIKRGGYYTAKFSGTNATKLQVTAGTGDVVTIVPINRGEDKLAAIVPIGKPGDMAGIYTTSPGGRPVKRFVAQIV